MQRTPSRLRLEALEDRSVPATVQLVNDTLIIDNPTGGLTLRATGFNSFNVSDLAADNDTFAVGGKIIIRNGDVNNSVVIDMDSARYTGDLFISLGNGNDTVNVVTSGAARIGGNVTILGGNGDDVVNFNSAEGGASGSLNVGGFVSFTDTKGANTFNLGNMFASTRVGGDLTVTGVNNVILGHGRPDEIAGSVNVRNSIELLNSSMTFGNGVMIGHDLNVQGGAGNDTV